MNFNRHITRNFDANKTNRIRYDEDDFRCEIFRYDKSYEQSYTPYTVDQVGGELGWFHGMRCLQSQYFKGENISLDTEMSIIFQYDAKETSSNYRLELLFANRHKVGKSADYDSSLGVDIKVYIGGEYVPNTMTSIVGTDVNFSRMHQYCKLKAGLNGFIITFSPNTIFLGAVIKKYEVWEASRHNNKNDDLTLIKATVEHTNDLSINTMTADFMYYHKLDEVLPPTDPNANRSGLIFDYRDEINLYVTDTDGIEQQVFGGYISTCEVDEDLKTLSMQCADRLIDLDRRYCLSEITVKGKSTDKVYKGFYDYKKNYNNYSAPLKFLMNNSELYLNTNISVSKPLVKENTWKLASYRKNGYNKFAKSNMSASLNASSVTLRNGADTLKPQHIVIYDNTKQHQTVELNKYPNLFFHYGLGIEKWEEKGIEYSTVDVQSNPTKTQKKWIDRLHTITTGTDEKSIKAVWRKVANFHQDKRANFFQSADKTWDSKNGNCCCKTECMLNLLNAMGIHDLKYVHMKKGGEGHVFAKVNGYYVDPSSTQESRGWKNHITYPKGASIIKVTDYPTKPF